jgi:hypothetical protein
MAKTRINLRVEEDVPAILERLAGGRNHMGDYLSRLLYVMENAGALDDMYKLDKRQVAVEEYVAELAVRVRYLERKLGDRLTHGDQLMEVLAQADEQNRTLTQVADDINELWTGKIRSKKND